MYFRNSSSSIGFHLFLPWVKTVYVNCFSLEIVYYNLTEDKRGVMYDKKGVFLTYESLSYF